MGNIKFAKFGSYIIVGGLATIVEWVAFFLLDRFGIQYIIATIIALVISTFANWLFGRIITFRGEKRQPIHLELGKIYLVSIGGVAFNVLLMWLFHGRLDLGSMLSKIIATIIVFIYNYLMRIKVVYREKD